MEDKKEAEKWKKLFLRVMGVMSLRIEEQGHELLPELYIQQLVGREPFCCFKRDSTGRGFRLSLVVDMSGSMHGTFDNVQRLTRVLQDALDFPFVHMKVRGFNTREAGKVNIYMYPRKTEGLVSSFSQVAGITPLSHAIQICGREMLGHRDDNHMFVLSDGFPVYSLANGKSLNTSALVQWTRDAVMDLRRQKVKVWCFMIGEHTPGTADMDTMFGHDNWRKIEAATLYSDSFSFLVKQFLRYVRTR